MGPTPTTDAPIFFTTLLASVLGPVVGPFSLTIFAALTGGLLSLSKAELDSRWAGARHLALSVAMSLVLTSTGVWLVSHYTSLPGQVAMMPVSFFIAASREYMLGFIKSCFDSAAAFVAKKTGG